MVSFLCVKYRFFCEGPDNYRDGPVLVINKLQINFFTIFNKLINLTINIYRGYIHISKKNYFVRTCFSIVLNECVVTIQYLNRCAPQILLLILTTYIVFMFLVLRTLNYLDRDWGRYIGNKTPSSSINSPFNNVFS